MTPPLWPADLIHNRGCKYICAIILTLPGLFLLLRKCPVRISLHAKKNSPHKADCSFLSKTH